MLAARRLVKGQAQIGTAGQLGSLAHHIGQLRAVRLGSMAETISLPAAGMRAMAAQINSGCCGFACRQSRHSASDRTR